MCAGAPVTRAPDSGHARSVVSAGMSTTSEPFSDPRGTLRALRIGYTSFSQDHRHPADRRRFPHFAAVYGLPLVEAKPGGDYDVVIVTQAADVTAWNRLPRGGARLIYDLIDSHLNAGFFNSPRELLRGVAKFVVRQSSSLVLDFRKAMAAMCRRADAVVCSTPEQAEILRRYNPSVHPILDFTSVAATQKKTDYAAGSPLRIVWEGHGSNARTVGVIAEPLRALARDRKIELHLITDLDYPTMLRHYGRRSTVRDVRRALRGIPTFFHEWNEGMLATVATACDMAVLPLPSSNQLYWYKAENRLLLFWRMGLPVIASATPGHRRTMRQADQDNYCSTISEWTKRLLLFASDENLRQLAGEGGRRWVEATWNDEQLLERWESVVRGTMGLVARRA